jgi:hypothetical protein
MFLLLVESALGELIFERFELARLDAVALILEEGGHLDLLFGFL